MTIGFYHIEPATCLAPMAGHTNRAFRELCRELGGLGLVCTELVSSQALEYSRQRAMSFFDFDPSEAPMAVQLFGGDPQTMAEAARLVVDLGAPMVDINMGCWVPKVVKKGGGAALLGDVCQATAVVEAVCKAVEVPVTVKVRSGLTAASETAVPFARAAEECGVQAIAVHARSAEQGFSGRPDWGVITRVRQAVNIPVFGNGDLTTLEEALQMQRETGCHGWMVGRAALGAPWIFAQWAGLLPGGIPPLPWRAAVALRHLQLTERFSSLNEFKAVRELRGQLSRYDLGVREQLVRLENYAQARELLKRLSGGVELTDLREHWRPPHLPAPESGATERPQSPVPP
ncbi:MAG: tRNA-dihydrouridine synthase [Candidatus Eremiobacteraeota bacterium]|nr:tRNA-dihydrouridine synthase [Candidatus Eremiobacteraeota bacterium]MCW5869198.1 tRNA-dihydrouridine synthase [Candidatus Eremiobacteraeota bacterium]